MLQSDLLSYCPFFFVVVEDDPDDADFDPDFAARSRERRIKVFRLFHPFHFCTLLSSLSIWWLVSIIIRIGYLS